MNTRIRIRRTLVAAGMAMAALTSAAPALANATPTPAEASALPSCTTYRSYSGLWGPSTSGGSVNCLLGMGNEGKAVRQLQHTMKYCARYKRNITVDGDFGSGTRGALKWVQRKERVTADGVYGPDTRKKMYFMVVDGPGNCQRLGR